MRIFFFVVVVAHCDHKLIFAHRDVANLEQLTLEYFNQVCRHALTVVRM